MINSGLPWIMRQLLFSLVYASYMISLIELIQCLEGFRKFPVFASTWRFSTTLYSLGYFNLVYNNHV